MNTASGQLDDVPCPRRGRWWKVSLLVLLTLISLWAAWRTILNIRVKAELDRIRAEGYPVDAAELSAWYAEPKEPENLSTLAY